MKKLHYKLLRDLATTKGLFLAVTAVIFLGVAFFGASFMAFQNLKASYDYSYQRLHFADFTVKVREAPVETVDKLRAVPGVKAVTGRMNTDLPLNLSHDGAKTVLARVISLPPASRPAVNDVKLEAGSYFQEGGQNTLLVEKSFAEHHRLKPEDTVLLTVGSQEVSFKVAGIVTSPEYIFPAKSRQEILVSPETFGVVFVPQDMVPEFLGKPVVNEFCIIVDNGADTAAIVDEAEEILSPYGVLDVVPREEQPSNAALKLDLQEFGEMAEVFPLLFLIIGALATYMLLTRIVHNQRPQIGLMRAVGYSRRKVLIHYLSFALIIGIVGSITGTVAGYLLSEAVTKLYISILGLPFTVIETHWLAIEEGILIGLIPCLIAGILPGYAASRLRPAEAMRTPPPTTGRKLLLERLFPFLTHLSSLWKVPLRNIFRNRRRSLSTVIGVAFGVSLILVSAAFIDSVEAILSLQFDEIQKYDAQINFAEPQPTTLVTEVQSWSEVTEAQPVLQVPTRLEHKGNTYSTLTVGLSPDSELYGLYSTSGEQARVTEEGILLGGALRKTLNIDVGDVIALRTPFGLAQLKVDGFVKQPMGSFGYVTLDQAQKLLGDQDVISGLMLDVSPQYIDDIREKAYQIPAIASVELTAESRQVVTDLFDLIETMMWIMLGFGAALALAIVFTMVTLGILERRREVATMRTLGEDKGKITAMVTIENLVLGLAGLIIGIPLGYGLALYFFSLFQTDMFSFDLVIFFRTYLLTTGLIIFIVLISQAPGIRHVNRLDLAKVIKEQVT